MDLNETLVILDCITIAKLPGLASGTECIGQRPYELLKGEIFSHLS
jgi:hypothetical protein